MFIETQHIHCLLQNLHLSWPHSIQPNAQWATLSKTYDQNLYDVNKYII